VQETVEKNRQALEEIREIEGEIQTSKEQLKQMTDMEKEWKDELRHLKSLPAEGDRALLREIKTLKAKIKQNATEMDAIRASSKVIVTRVVQKERILGDIQRGENTLVALQKVYAQHRALETAREASLADLIRKKERYETLHNAVDLVTKVRSRPPSSDSDLASGSEMELKLRFKEARAADVTDRYEKIRDEAIEGAGSRSGFLSDLRAVEALEEVSTPESESGSDTTLTESERISSRSSRRPRRKYRILVTTGSTKRSGTDTAVFMQLWGDGRHVHEPNEVQDVAVICSGVFELALSGSNERKFQPNQIDIFDHKLPDLGNLVKLSVWHNGKGKHDGWLLEAVEVQLTEDRDPSKHPKWLFPCHRWLDSKKDDGRTERLLLAQRLAEETEGWSVEIILGDRQGSPCTANPYIVLYSGNHESRKTPLIKQGFAQLMPGTSYRFDIKTVDLGEGMLQQIRLGHDNGGNTPNLFVEEIFVTRHSDKRTWCIPCLKWFGKEHDGGHCDRVFIPATTLGTVEDEFSAPKLLDDEDAEFVGPPAAALRRLKGVSKHASSKERRRLEVRSVVFVAKYGAEHKAPTCVHTPRLRRVGVICASLLMFGGHRCPVQRIELATLLKLEPESDDDASDADVSAAESSAAETADDIWYCLRPSFQHLACKRCVLVRFILRLLMVIRVAYIC
jgi:hypothetical protein